MGLLTTKEAAEKLGVSVRRVQAMINDERLKAQKFGRDYVIDEKELISVSGRKVGRPPKVKAMTKPLNTRK